MARPYILIQREVLTELEELHFKGVPTRKLVRQFNLSIASPTLQRLINYLSLASRSIVDGQQSLTTRQIIYASLFPAWLDGVDTDEVSQPPDWHYEGSMPLGKWVKKERKTE